MAPSSLIFVVIVGVWAAFFVQYWVRRREHIATARSVDAFSETMRVLQVRDPQPKVDLDGPKRRSYAVSPTRTVRPHVTVKRAEALRTPADHAWVAPVGESGTEGTHQWPVGSPRRRVRVRVTRATRGLTFVVGMLATLVYAVLSATGVLRPWAVAVPLVFAVGGFLWVRAGVKAERRAEWAERSGHGPEVRSTTSRSRGAAEPVVGAGRGALGRTEGAQGLGVDEFDEVDGAGSTGRGRSGSVVDRRDVLFDVDGPALDADLTEPAAPAPAARAAAPLLDEDDMPLTWDPVPVPRPTYAMKAQAHRVPVPPAAAAPSTPRTMAPIVADYDDDVPEVFPVRRVVGG